jgi:cytochrome c oxidase subunit 2
VAADDAYIRESILNPQAKIVSGFTPIMPTFQGLVTEEQLLQLIAYVKSLSDTTGTGPVTPPTATPPPAPK